MRHRWPVCAICAAQYGPSRSLCLHKPVSRLRAPTPRHRLAVPASSPARDETIFRPQLTRCPCWQARVLPAADTELRAHCIQEDWPCWLPFLPKGKQERKSAHDLRPLILRTAVCGAARWSQPRWRTTGAAVISPQERHVRGVETHGTVALKLKTRWARNCPKVPYEALFDFEFARLASAGQRPPSV
jgi:hypothetical protein